MGRKHTKQREHFFSLNDVVILCKSEVGRWAHNLDILVAAPFPRKPNNESIIFSKFVVMSFKLLSSSQLARRSTTTLATTTTMMSTSSMTTDSEEKRRKKNFGSPGKH